MFDLSDLQEKNTLQKLSRKEMKTLNINFFQRRFFLIENI